MGGDEGEEEGGNYEKEGGHHVNGSNGKVNGTGGKDIPRWDTLPSRLTTFFPIT